MKRLAWLVLLLCPPAHAGGLDDVLAVLTDERHKRIVLAAKEELQELRRTVKTMEPDVRRYALLRTEIVYVWFFDDVTRSPNHVINASGKELDEALDDFMANGPRWK